MDSAKFVAVFGDNANSEARETRPKSAVLTYATFPVVLFGAAALGMKLLSLGVKPAAINPLIVPPVFLLVILLERIHPHAKAWNRSHGDFWTDAGYFFVTALTVLATTATLGAVLVPIAGRLAAHAPLLIWPHHWPLLAQVVLATVTAEFGHYWIHRASHGTKFLWRFHSVHHSSARLYWLNTARFHPVDMMMSTVLGFGPLVFFGCGERVIALFTLIGTIHNVFQHSNIQLRLGPLNYVFSMAELHRWHHSTNLEEANKNFGGHLACWDLAFGTYFLPRDRTPPEELGLADQPDFPKTLLGQLAAPFASSHGTAPERESAPGVSGLAAAALLSPPQ